VLSAEHGVLSARSPKVTSRFGTQYSELSTRNSALSTQYSELSTQNSLLSNLRMHKLRTVVIIAVAVAQAAAQQPGTSPTQTVINFYRALKQKRYVEGFHHSVYRAAVEGLSAAELKDLEPDFAKTFAAIPDKIEPRDEQISGDSAVVKLTFEGMNSPQEVGLIRVGGEWLVGDQEALTLVRAQGRSFFFNTRILVNESEAVEMLQRIIGAEIIYSRKFEGAFATLPELVKLGGVPKDIDDQSGAYKYNFSLAPDKKSFSATAIPSTYGRSGRTSFYADFNGIRAEDLKGRPASASSPIYVPR